MFPELDKLDPADIIGAHHAVSDKCVDVSLRTFFWFQHLLGSPMEHLIPWDFSSAEAPIAGITATTII